MNVAVPTGCGGAIQALVAGTKAVFYGLSIVGVARLLGLELSRLLQSPCCS
ncbi:MAG: hypothetical protein U9N12_03845 [Euryarchaeota archaeon]|nr:hypothetical protein [Euryarchaeota archaeon]